MAPSDVLYIPPYWFHAVLATSDAVSLAVVTESYEQGMSTALWNDEPRAWQIPQSRCEKAHVFGGFVNVQARALAAIAPPGSLFDGETGRSYAKSLYDTRFGSLAAVGALGKRDAELDTCCKNGLLEAVDEEEERVEFMAFAVAQLEPKAQRVAAILHEHDYSGQNEPGEGSRFSEGVMRIDLGDAIEAHARIAVDVESIHHLLLHVANGRCTVEPLPEKQHKRVGRRLAKSR